MKYRQTTLTFHIKQNDQESNPALSLRLDSKPTVNLEHVGTWTDLGKEDLDDNFHQLLLRDSENH